MNRPRRVVSTCLAVLALGALSACSSQPGNRRVVRDVIESLGPPNTVLSVPQEECMLERLEGYTDDELNAIADENENWDPAGAGSTLEDASEGMRLFISDFEECTEGEGGETDGSTATSDPTATSEPTATTAA